MSSYYDKPTEKDVLDALECDSSMEGCDPDWRRHVLETADPKIVKEIKGRLAKPDALPSEIETSLSKEGKVK